MSKFMFTAAAIVVSLAAAASPASSQVHVSVNIGTPPAFVAAPPPLVVVPGSPVYYAPGYDYELFFYGGRYYTQFNGAWFWAPRPGARWIGVSTVPRPLLAVPVEYHNRHGKGGHCPPGQAKKGRC